MKAFLTLILILAIGTPSIAQVDGEKKIEEKPKLIEIENLEEKKASEQQKITRVYLYKNSRIKKELKFKTKKNKSKLA
ncbi:hypothetical protein [Croceivirga thetidis]|uniref:Uncharacterized protein n=1 Tax=Croceivirga thetidis TaxID=2721623 RepID=A0ABX1GTD6_9FLAO|nr:hypothetical protein [Croceivirga thetidis]NKI32884.1 hypothetical protein [Croceivirga thetidis]